MANIDDIILTIDEDLISRNKRYVTLSEANRLLIEKNVFTKIDSKNKTLRLLLETNQIPNAFLANTLPKEWRIPLSNSRPKRKKVVKRKQQIQKEPPIIGKSPDIIDDSSLHYSCRR